MPDIGDVARGVDIGRRSTDYYVYVECDECGESRWAVKALYKRGGARMCRSCSNTVKCHHFIAENHGHSGKWVGYRTVNSRGYAFVSVAADDPFHCMVKSRQGHRVAEHRLVMARHLGRPLEPWELVHHKPGVAKDDNRIGNLVLVNRSSHIHADENQVKELIQKVNMQDEQLRLLKWQVSHLNGEVRELKKALQLKLEESRHAL